MSIKYKYLNRLIYFVLLAGFSGIYLNSCYWDNEEYLYPSIGGCDTTVFTYSGAVQPILDSYCLSCHRNSVAASYGGNIKLGTYTDVKTYVSSGQLLGAIKHSGGYAAMPQGSSKLADCKITIIEKWINNGSPND